MSDERDTSRPDWVNEAEEALDRATEAIRTAWEESRESRIKALDSARHAARQLGEAIDRGVDAVRNSWQSDEGSEQGSGDDEAPPQPSGVTEEE